jgi:CRP-like cAMP-binding protein
MSEDEFESEEEIENKNKIFLMPNSIVHYIVDFLLILACIYDIFFYTFYIAYYANELEIFFSIKFHKIIIIFIDYLYILDFLLSFFTAYYDYDENLITKLDKIFFNYITSFGLFDLILSIPINSILIKSINNKSIKYISSYNNKQNLIFLITYIKKLKMIKICSGLRNNILSFIQSFHHFTFYGHIYTYSLVFFAILHNVISLYIFIGKNTYPNWIVYLNLNNNKSEFFKIYIDATYYIISTVTTVGYGDISTYTLTEKIFGVLLLLVGIFAYSFAVTSVSNYVQKINSKNEEYEKRIEIFQDILKQNPHISSELTEQIFRNLKYQYNTEKKSFDFNEIYDGLPLGLKNSLIMNMYKPIIEKFIFFKGLSNKDFIVRILLSFKPLIAVKNDILIKNGDFMEEIIFIKTGKLSLDVPVDLFSQKKNGNSINNSFLFSNRNLSNNDTKEKTIIFDNNCINFTNKFKNDYLKERLKQKFLNKEKKITTYIQILTLRENEHFGIITIFLNKRSILRVKVRSKESELLLLKKEDILELASQFPQIWKKINQRSLINYNQVQLLIKKAIEIYNMTNNIIQNIPDDYNWSDESSSSSSFYSSSSTKKNKKEKNFNSNSESSSSSHVEKYLKNKNEKENKLKSNLKKKKSSNLIVNKDKNNNEKNKKKNSDSSKKNNNYKIFLSNADKKTFQTITPLTPFKDSQINDEIYPGEDFMICKSSNNNITKNIIFEENTVNIDSNFLNIHKNYSSKMFEFKKKTKINFDIVNEECFTLDSSYENLNEISNYSYSDNKLIQAEVKNLISGNKKNDFYKTINYNDDNSYSSITSEEKKSNDNKSNNYSISKPVSPSKIKFAKFDKRNKCYSFNNVSI